MDIYRSMILTSDARMALVSNDWELLAYWDHKQLLFFYRKWHRSLTSSH